MRQFLSEFWQFGIKQASASIFGGFLLFAILLSKMVYPEDAWLHRYDFLFILAIVFQLLLLLLRFETIREAAVILIFHAVATAMEIFKTSDAIKSWEYPEEFTFGFGNVPLFAGFMYSAVGSYIARVWRIFDFKFSFYPPIWLSVILVSLIYMNFFTHHFIIDLRYGLLVVTGILYCRCWIYYRPAAIHRRMPLLLGWVLVALFIWIAENIATYSDIWIYPSQTDGWSMVPISKLLAWFLLMILSFVLVSLIQRPQAPLEHQKQAP